MAMKEHWIQKSITKKNKGKFSAKAKRAGKSTIDYAEEESSAPGTLGKEAREAKTLINMH